MNRLDNETPDTRSDIEAMQQAIASLQETLDIQRRVSYAAGLFQGEVTIRTLIDCFCQAKSGPFDDRKWNQWASVIRNMITENRAR